MLKVPVRCSRPSGEEMEGIVTVGIEGDRLSLAGERVERAVVGRAELERDSIAHNCRGHQLGRVGNPLAKLPSVRFASVEIASMLYGKTTGCLLVSLRWWSQRQGERPNSGGVCGQGNAELFRPRARGGRSAPRVLSPGGCDNGRRAGEFHRLRLTVNSWSGR